MAKVEIYKASRRRGKWYLASEINRPDLGALALWMYLEEKYLGLKPSLLDPDIKYTRMASLKREDRQEIWDLCEDKRLSSHERLVLFSTFDKNYLLIKDVPLVAESMRKVHQEMGGYSNFGEQADALLNIYENHKEAEVIVINATSVLNYRELFGSVFNPDNLYNLMEDYLKTEALVQL